MILILLADLVAVLHGLLICCVIAGSAAAISGLLRRLPRVELAFYLLIACVVASDIFLGDCVLTRLEQSLRNALQPGFAYRGSYIGHYCFFLPAIVHKYIGPTIVVAAILAFPFWRWRDVRKGRHEALPT